MNTMKRYKREYSVLNSKVFSTCLAGAMIFENVGFLIDKRNPAVF